MESNKITVYSLVQTVNFQMVAYAVNIDGCIHLMISSTFHKGCSKRKVFISLPIVDSKDSGFQHVNGKGHTSCGS